MRTIRKPPRALTQDANQGAIDATYRWTRYANSTHAYLLDPTPHV